MSRPLAVAVAEYLLHCEAHPGEWGHVEIPRGAGAALARLVEAAQEASESLYEEFGTNEPSTGVDDALRDVAAALDIETPPAGQKEKP